MLHNNQRRCKVVRLQYEEDASTRIVEVELELALKFGELHDFESHDHDSDEDNEELEDDGDERFMREKSHDSLKPHHRSHCSIHQVQTHSPRYPPTHR